ncbi:MAG: AAA family ATPase [Pseudomonadota bacterium]
MDDDTEDGFGFDDVLRILKRYWRSIIACGATFAVITAQIMMLVPNRYEAVANVQLEQRKRQILDVDSVIQRMDTDASAIESEVEILRSADLALIVVDRLKLRSDPEFTRPGWFAKLLVDLGISAKDEPSKTDSGVDLARKAERQLQAIGSADTVRDYLREATQRFKDPERDDVLQGFRDRMKVERIRNSRMIKVVFTSEDAAKSARIANAIVDLYIEAQINAKDRAEALAARLLDRRIVKLRKKLTTSERRLEAFKSENDLFDANGGFVLEKRLTQETAQLVSARNRTAEARARYEQAERLLTTGGDTSALGNVIDSNIVSTLRGQLSRALRAQAQLQVKYGPRHPAIQKINADVSKARSELVDQINSIVRNFRSELRVAEGRERQLTEDLARLKVRIQASKGKLWELDELTRETTTSRKLYEQLLARSKQMKETAGLQFPDSRVAQLATVPLTPSGPKRKQFVFLALFGGLALAFGTAFLFDSLRPGFETAQDAEKQLLVDQVAGLPAFAEANPPDRLRNARYLIAEPRSLYAEAMRGLAHVVSVRRPGPQILLVVSALNGEGRSTTASNLAVQFAIGGSKTLLIDADLRGGGLSRTLGLTSQPGLADVIAGSISPSAAILRDASTGLHVLPSVRAGAQLSSPVETLNSTEAFSLFDVLRGHFDIVIVDAPPLLPVADARVLSDICDSGLMIVKWRSTARSHVKQALRTLGPNQSKIIGLVMSGIAEAEYAAQVGLRSSNLSALRGDDVSVNAGLPQRALPRQSVA